MGERAPTKTSQHILSESTHNHGSGLTEGDQMGGVQANILAAVHRESVPAATVYCTPDKGQPWAKGSTGIFSVDPHDNSMR